MRRNIQIVSVLVVGVIIGAAGTTFLPNLIKHISNNDQPYAGQNQRVISSLSKKDIAELEKGAGWGLAKPAEFNGYPGPAHVLEFADKLDLEDQQREAIEASFKAMNAKARELGVALIEAEEALDAAFKTHQATPALLNERLKVTEQIRSALRAVHLSAHLEITPILTEKQKMLYAELRGYSDGHNNHAGH